MMKCIIAIAVISCFVAVASAQIPDVQWQIPDVQIPDVPNQKCLKLASDLSSCVSRLTVGGEAFCNECGDRLFSYYQECGLDTSAVTQGLCQNHANYESANCMSLKPCSISYSC